jgi:excisionase family DNA binding protein
MNDWLTATEAAAYLKVSPRTIVQWAKQGKIPGHRLSGSRRITWRFLRSELDATILPPSAAIENGGLNAAEK